MSGAYVFTKEGVYRAPEPCEIYRDIVAQREALRLRLIEVSCGQTLYPPALIRQVQERYQQTCLRMQPHIEVCGLGCQEWLASMVDGSGLARCSAEEAAQVWAALDRRKP